MEVEGQQHYSVRGLGQRSTGMEVEGQQRYFVRMYHSVLSSVMYCLSLFLILWHDFT